MKNEKMKKLMKKLADSFSIPWMEEAIKLRYRQIELEKRIKADSVLQDYVNEKILSAFDAQKVANLICEQMTLISLVKEMRKAQEDVGSFLDYGDVPNAYFHRMSELEDKVDNLLKGMEGKE